MHEAAYYRAEGAQLRCLLCPHNCLIAEGDCGICRVRLHRSGRLYSLNYGTYTSIQLDRIEKKPLYHFYPGSKILSLGSWGCNFSCPFCQNWELSQGAPAAAQLLPPQAVEMALNDNPPNIGLAFTYSEPFVWYEYVRDTACLAREAGLKVVLVTNGFIRPEPLAELLPFVDAMNIDLKGFTEKFYKRLCGGALAAVQETLAAAAAHCHVEVTTLVVPGENDNPAELDALAAWLGSVRRDIPLHFTRYFPRYRMSRPPTSAEVLREAQRLAQKYLDYVYIGNLETEDRGTFCPRCGQLVIDRWGGLRSLLTEDNCCAHCHTPIALVGSCREQA